MAQITAGATMVEWHRPELWIGTGGLLAGLAALYDRIQQRRDRRLRDEENRRVIDARADALVLERDRVVWGRAEGQIRELTKTVLEQAKEIRQLQTTVQRQGVQISELTQDRDEARTELSATRTQLAAAREELRIAREEIQRLQASDAEKSELFRARINELEHVISTQKSVVLDLSDRLGIALDGDHRATFPVEDEE